MRTNILFRDFLPLLFVTLTLPAYQNCSPQLNAQDDISDVLMTSGGLKNCRVDSGYACLFAKSPVNKAGRSVKSSDLPSLQSYSGEISDLDSSGYLQNSDFEVHTSKTDRLRTVNGFNHSYSSNSSYLEQLMVYHFANKTRKWMISRKEYKKPTRAFKIYVDSTFTGWIPHKYEMHFQKDEKRLSAALDGSLIVSTFLQSQMTYASGDKAHQVLGSKTVSCSDSRSYLSPKYCCSTRNGCGAAIISGAADFAVALIFEDQGTEIAETWKNDPAGQTICSVNRNPATQSTLTAASAYGRCSIRNAVGLVPLMGVVYSSIWWEMRQKVTQSQQVKFEQFFLRHLSLIAGDDDFLTMKAKLLSLDRSEFDGSFQSIINSEFARRGL